MKILITKVIEKISAGRAFLGGALAPTLLTHAAIACLYLSVLLAPDVLPLVDLGGHVELGMALRHLGDGSPLARAFEYGTFPAPNSIFYLLFYVATVALSPLAAAKFVVAIYLIATPLAVCYLLSVTNKNVAWSLGAYPLLLSWPFQSGFIDYCLSFAPMFVGFAVLWRVLHEGLSRGRTIALITFSALVFLSHFQGAVFYLLGCACLLLTHAPRASRASWMSWGKAAVASVGVVVALMAFWFLQSRSLVSGEHSPPSTWQPIEGKLRAALAFTFFVLDSDYDGLILYFVVGAMVLARMLAPRRASSHLDPFVLLAFATMVVHALAPVTIGLYWNFDNRIPALFAFFALIALAPEASPSVSIRSTLVGVSFAASALATLLVWIPAMEKFERWNTGFLDTLSYAPAESKLAFYLEDQNGSGFATAPTRHYAGYHAALNLGVNSSSFADHPGRIVVQRNLGNDFEFADTPRIRSPRGLDGYQALMQRGSSRLERDFPSRFELVSRKGKWSLYAITQ